MTTTTTTNQNTPTMDSPIQSGMRVTHHFVNGVRHVSRITRRELGELSKEPRRRRLSISWDDVPRLVLIAVTPHSRRARAALPVLVSFLQSNPGLVVAVDEAIASNLPPSVAIVRPNQPLCSNNLCSTGPVVTSMSDLRLTDSIVSSSNGSESNGLIKSTKLSQSEETTYSETHRKVYSSHEVDLVMCLGGDGLIFHVISEFFPEQVPPVVPFNMGSMGFLTPFDFANHEKDVRTILDGVNNNVTMRLRLKCVIEREPVATNGVTSPCVHNFEDNMLKDEAVECSPVEEFHVLNELVIDRGPAPYLCNLEVLCDDCPVTRVQADGLIVATPTGSTAYSLSSGGSMVHPSVPAILFTPICPHSLSFRPVLFPDHVTLQITVPKDSRATAWVSFDGRHRMELRKGDKVVVSVSPWSVPTFSRTDTTNDWFASVSQCLRWNERVVQGHSESDTEKLQ